MSSFRGILGGRQVSSPIRPKISSQTDLKATQNAKQSIEYGTKIVGGVTPGRTGEHLGLPLLPSVRAVSEAFPHFFLRRKRKF